MDNHEKNGILLSLFGALFLSVLGISFSFITGSQAVLLDGIFNCISVFTAWFALKISNVMDEPFSERMPAGYIAFEPFYILVKGLIVFGLSATVMVTSLLTLLSGGHELKLGIVVIYVGIASFANIIFYMIVRNTSSRSSSPMLEVEKENWFINMLVTLSIALAFILVMILKDGALKSITKYIDQIIVIIVVLVSLPVPMKAIRSGFKELMLFGADQSLYNQLKTIIDPLSKDFPSENYKLFILKTGRKYWISIFLQPTTSMVKTSLADDLKEKIKKELEHDFPINNVDVIITGDLDLV